MDWLLDFLGLNKGKGTIEAANQNKELLAKLGIDLNGIIDSTDAAQKGYLNEAAGLTDLGPGGQGMVGDALGLGGEAGKTRAMEAFQGSNPGYDFQVNTGLDAIDRRAASRGMLGSGNTNLDTINYASGVANQSFGDWFDRLLGGVDRQTGALGDLATQTGNIGATRLGVTGDLASASMGANNQVAAGREAGQGGFWDILGNVAGTAGAFMGNGGFGGFGGGTGQGRTGPNTYGRSSGQYGLGYGGGF